MLLYPFFATAAVLCLSGAQRYGSSLEDLIARSYLFGCLAYIIVYCASLFATLKLRRKRKRVAALTMSSIPILYLALLACVAFSWLLSDAIW